MISTICCAPGPIRSASTRRRSPTPTLITEGAIRFGSQCIVLSIDAAATPGGGWEVRTHGGRRGTGIDAVEWARRGVALGAGEIVLNSIDADGTREGYELGLTAAVSRVVRVPVVASGGRGVAGAPGLCPRSGGARRPGRLDLPLPAAHDPRGERVPDARRGFPMRAVAPAAQPAEVAHVGE